MSYKIPLGRPFLGKEEIAAVRKVMESRLIAWGNRVKEFEEMFAKKIGRKYCVMVNSGTSALWLSMKVLGLRNAVIIPTLTCLSLIHI